ncbi:helix-turn-helix domain-containing protein [Streptomyces lydicus]|uniref:helix-turn-helix domain-containing protein n=1 Tax=Streptomyces lydicus TaxID=47763 RepID=UPI0036EC48EA
MDLDWKTLAAELRQARNARMLTMVELADRADVSRSTLHSLEQGDARGRIPSSLGKVEAALGWPPGQAMKILKGERLHSGELAGVNASEIERSISYAALAVADDMTAAQIKELARRAIEDLRHRGII